MSRELPIIFNTEMVKAILEGKKVTTRRPFTEVQKRNFNYASQLGECSYFQQNGFLHENDPSYILQFAPYQVGDILYVRETWSDPAGEGYPIIYKADAKYGVFHWGKDSDGIEQTEKENAFKYRPSIHMPKEYARLWLKVTGVRVERVQDIAEGQAQKEGIKPRGHVLALDDFRLLWDSLYKNWDSNPWVWVIDFEVIKK